MLWVAYHIFFRFATICCEKFHQNFANLFQKIYKENMKYEGA